MLYVFNRKILARTKYLWIFQKEFRYKKFGCSARTKVGGHMLAFAI